MNNANQPECFERNGESDRSSWGSNEADDRAIFGSRYWPDPKNHLRRVELEKGIAYVDGDKKDNIRLQVREGWKGGSFNKLRSGIGVRNKRLDAVLAFHRIRCDVDAQLVA